MRKKMLFLDGVMTSVTKTFVDNLSPGVLLGKGVFETMRSYGGVIFALDAHLARLDQGLKTLKMKSPYSTDEITHYLYSSLKTNRLKNARLRLTLWEANRRVKISIIAFPYQPYSQSKYARGFKAVFSDTRRDEHSKLSCIKSINYLPFILALRRAKEKGNDEAIFLNRGGYLAEGSRSNIFFVKKSKLYTPGLATGCLNGITRQVVLKVARAMKVDCKEVAVVPGALLDADEAFLTNSLVEIMPLTAIEGKKIGNGKAGPLTCKILAKYRKLTQKGTLPSFSG